MAKKVQSMKMILILTFALIISLAVVLIGTLSALQDSKSATGTVTFNLADYDLYVADANVATSGNIAPGYSGTTDTMKVVNSYKTTDGKLYGTADPEGVTAGMGGVYLKMTITSVTVADKDNNGSSETIQISNLQYNSVEDQEGIVLNNGSGLKITLNSAANSGKGLYWYYSGSDIYLSSAQTSLAQTTLAFSDSLVNETAANICFTVSIDEPQVDNGFNATGSTAPDVNKYQGKTVTINYTLKWATTTTGLNG